MFSGVFGQSAIILKSGIVRRFNHLRPMKVHHREIGDPFSGRQIYYPHWAVVIRIGK